MSRAESGQDDDGARFVDVLPSFQCRRAAASIVLAAIALSPTLPCQVSGRTAGVDATCSATSVHTHTGVGSTAVEQPVRPAMPALRRWLRGRGLEFVENRGQWDVPARFVARRGNVSLLAEADGLWIDLRELSEGASEPGAGAFIEIGFEDTSSLAQVSGHAQVLGTRNYLKGNDPSTWCRDVLAFGSLEWRGIWPGVDMVLRDGAQGAIAQYVLYVTPGQALGAARFRVEGSSGLEIDHDGSLVIQTAVGPLRQTAPVAWEELPDGSQRSLAARFTVIGPSAYGFEVDGRDPSLRLVVDPGLLWAGYVGGSDVDVPRSLARTSTGDVVLVGETWSSNFPTTPGAYQPTSTPDVDAFVMKVSADGTSVVFATYVGGAVTDWGRGVVLDELDRPIVTGWTDSPGFPTTPGAWDTTLAQRDAYALRLSADGSHLEFSTLVGGSDLDSGVRIARTADGGLILAGATRSLDFPGTSGSAQATSGGTWDAFVSRLRPDGTLLLWATYLGGIDQDIANGLAIGVDGSIVVCGSTESVDFPVTAGAFDTVYSPIGAGIWTSGFVSRISADGKAVVFSTFLDCAEGPTLASAIDINAELHVAVTGVTSGADNPAQFPSTPGAYDPDFGMDSEAFVTVLTMDGASLVYSTSLGSDLSGPKGSAITIEDSGVVTVAGGSAYEQSAGTLTTPGAHDTSAGVFADAFVVRLKPAGDGLLYGTLVGGSPGSDDISDIALDAKGRVLATGAVIQGNFPVTPGAFDTTFAGTGIPGVFGEGVLFALELQPLGVTSFGQSTPACLGPIRLTALGEPKAGSGTFAIACAGAPPGALGVLAVGAGGLSVGIPLAGIQVHLDPAQPFLLLGALADGNGYDETTLPLPVTAAGIIIYTQAAWIDTGGCAGTFAMSASDALQVTVSPP